MTEALIDGHGIHRLLAQNATSEAMLGGLENWCSNLKKKLSMNFYVAHEVKELFLIRNCIVHNNRRCSDFLSRHSPDKYPRDSPIDLSEGDIHEYKNTMYSFALKLAGEYERLFPVNKGSWVDEDRHQ